MQVADGMDGQPIQPGLERQLVGLVSAIAQGRDDYLVNHFFLGD